MAKKVTERNIKNKVRRAFREILVYKEYIFVALLFFFLCMVMYEFNNEKMIALIFSILSVQYVLHVDEKRKEYIKEKKLNSN